MVDPEGTRYVASDTYLVYVNGNVVGRKAYFPIFSIELTEITLNFDPLYGEMYKRWVSYVRRGLQELEDIKFEYKQW